MQTVESMYESSKDARYYVPVLGGLDKPKLFALLPALLQLSSAFVKNVLFSPSLSLAACLVLTNNTRSMCARMCLGIVSIGTSERAVPFAGDASRIARGVASRARVARHH